MIPGPTPVPERVLEALGRHPIGHRSKDFQNIVKSTTENLQWLHQTKNEILTITGSGTCLLYTSPSPRDEQSSRMPSSA